MHVAIEELSPVEKKLVISLDWPYVSAKLDEAYRELGKGVTLRGFRRGKVPRQMLEKLFSRQVEKEVTEKLLQETFFRAASQHDLHPVADPVVNEVELKKGDGFRYSAKVEVRAAFEVRDYDGVELDPPAITVDEAALDQAVERKREELAEMRTIEGRDTLGPSDIAFVDVVGVVAGKPIKREGLMVDLSRPDRDPIDGLAKALLGQPMGAKDLDVPVALPGGEGQTTHLQVTVREAREKVLPALDDDFAKDTGEADTLGELRTKLRAQLVKDQEQDRQSELKRQLIRELVRRHSFPVAGALVERQTELLLRRYRLGMAVQGIDPKAGGFDETRLREELKEPAANDVRAAFLIDAIAEKEKVEVTEADLEKRLAEMARSRDKSVPRLKAELQKEGRLDGIRHSLREEKTLDLLLSRANIRPSSPSENQP